MGYSELNRLNQSFGFIGNVERLHFILGIHSAHKQLKERHVDEGGTLKDSSELNQYPVIITPDSRYVVSDADKFFLIGFLDETANAYRSSGEIYAEKKRRK